jgi:hypothetical protein
MPRMKSDIFLPNTCDYLHANNMAPPTRKKEPVEYFSIR